MLLRPRFFTKPDVHLSLGVGVPHPSTVEVRGDGIFRHMFFELCVHIRRAECAPLVGCRSLDWQLDKKNSKLGTFGLRLLHGLCCLWRAYFRGIYARDGRPPVANYDHGSAPGRRREEAMAAARIMSWRLMQAGLWFVVGSKDMTNAFACDTHESLQANLGRLTVDDQQLLWVRRVRAHVTVQGSDGDAEVLAGANGLEGDSNAPDESLASFATPIEKMARKHTHTHAAVSIPVHLQTLS